MDTFISCLGVIALLVLSSVVTGLVVMFLWNWLMPVIFELTTISYLQGFGLSVLCGMLFKTTVSTKS